MARDVKDYARSCMGCQLHKPADKSWAPHQTLLAPAEGWPYHALRRTIRPLGRRAMGYWSWSWWSSLPSVTTSSLSSNSVPPKIMLGGSLMGWSVRLHGLSIVIVSVIEATFIARLWQSLFPRSGTKLAASSAYHPQTNEQPERMVRTLKEMLRSHVDYCQNDWTHRLSAVEPPYNNVVQASTQLTPFELDAGYRLELPIYFLPMIDLLSRQWTHSSRT
jgi:hypothetical protein